MAFKFNPITGQLDLVSGTPTGTADRFAGFSSAGYLEAITSWVRNTLGGADVSQTITPTDTGSTQSFILNQFNGTFTPTNDLTNTYLYGQTHVYDLAGIFDYIGFEGDELSITQSGNNDILGDLTAFFPRVQLGVGGSGTSQTTRSILATIRESGTHQANSLRPIEAQASIDGGAFSQESTSFQGSTYVGGSGDFTYGLNQYVQVAGTMGSMYGINLGMSIDPGALVDNGWFLNSGFSGNLVNGFFGINTNFNGDTGGDFYAANLVRSGGTTAGNDFFINLNDTADVTGNSYGINYGRNGATAGSFTFANVYVNNTSPVTNDFRFFNLGNDAAISQNAAGTLIFNNGNIAKGWTGYGQYMNCDIGDGGSNIVGYDANFQNHTLNGVVTGYNFNNNSIVTGPIYGFNFSNSGAFTGDLNFLNFFNNADQTGSFGINALNVTNNGTGYRFNGANIFHNANMTEEILGYRFNSTGDARTTTGLDISMQGNITDDAQGIRVNVNNLTSSSVSNHIHSLDLQGGVVSMQSAVMPFSGVGVDIGNNFTCTTSILNGSPLTGTDQIIQLIQSNLLADDDIATGPFGLNTTMVGVATQVAVGSGKTIPLLRSMLLGTTVPQGSGGTITEHVVLELLGLPSFGGSVTCPTKIGIQDSQLVGQNFSDGTTESWFIRNNDPNTENHLSKLAINTTSKKVSFGGIKLEVIGDVIIDGLINDTSNVNSIDSSNRLLKDASSNDSADWSNRQIFDGSGAASLNWADRTLRNTDTDIVARWSDADQVFELFGHVRNNGATPTIVADAGAGTGATASVTNATDTAGKITIVTGTLGVSTGSYATLTFNQPYTTAPIVVLTPASGTLSSSVYVTTTTTTMSINFAVAGGITSTYDIYYHSIETY